MKKSHLPTSRINRVIAWLAVSLVVANIVLGQVTSGAVWAVSEVQTRSPSVVSTSPVTDEAGPPEISVDPIEVEVKAQPSAWQRLLKSTGIRANYQGIKAEIRNSEGEKVEDVVSDDSNLADQFVFHLDPAKLELTPGKYQLVVEYAGEVIYQDFTYGVLAVNATKDVYTLGEAASLELAALDSYGTTLCNANLLLTITAPSGEQTNPEVIKSGECDGNNVTDVPDYSAEYVPELEGEYRLKLQNLDQNFVIESSFQVATDPEFSIERLGPSRIYPVAPYLMKLNVYSKNGFSGTVSESVPSLFAVESDGASKSQRDERTIVSWPVEIAPGETTELAYLFDAPDVSPQFYSLGSIQLFDHKNLIYTESRQWQIASDDTSTRAIGSESGTNWSASGGCTFGTNCVTTSNNLRATFNGTGRNTLYLKNVGFSIPAGSTIDGIGIGFEGYGSGTTAARRTIRLNITKDGTNATDATWNTQAFTTGEASYTTGSSTDLWGTTWTVSDINATNFGVMISDNNTTAHALYIDYVTVTVYYTPPVTINVSGSTNVASGTVKWAKNGVAQAETATIGSGTWSLSIAGLAQNDIVTTWIDGAGETDESTAITKYDGTGDITGMVLNANVLSVGSVDNPSIVMSNFAYTNSSDEDVMHSYSSSTLTVDGGSSYSTEKLDVLSGATLTIGTSEIVNTHHLSINGTLTSGGSSTYNVYGNWENNATFTASTSTVDFKLASGTQTLKSGGTGAGKLFNNLTHSGAGTLQLNTNAIDVDGNFSQTAGTFDANSLSQNFAGDFSLSSSTVFTKGGTTTFDGSVAKAITDSTTGQQDLGAVVIDGTSKSVSTATNLKLTTLTIGGDDTLDISSDTLTILGSGTPFTKTGTFTTTGSTVVYAGTTATNVTTAAYNNLTFTPASGTPTYTLQASLTGSDAIAGNLTISTGATLSTSASNFNLEVKGNWANAGSFVSGTNTVTFSATATGKTIVTGGTGTGQDFNHVVFNSSSGGWTIQTNDMKVAGNLTITDVSDWTLQTGRILEVNGQYTITGNETTATTWTGSTLYINNGTSTSYTINSVKTASAETYGTLQIGASTDVRMWNSTATTFTVDATGSLYSQNHANTVGDLYIWGDYNVVGTDYWSYVTDFDGVALGTSRQANVRIDPAGGVTVGSGKTLSAIGTSSFRTTVDRQGASNGYGLTIAGGTINFNYVNFDRLDGNKGLDIQTGSTVTSLDYTKYDNLAGTAGTDDAFITLHTSIVGTGSKTLTGLQFDNTGTGAEFNVNLSGTAVTGYWDFDSSTGTFDGESYDGASGVAEADPGTLRWDDSAQPPLAPTDLLAEGATNPTGIIDLTPELSAIYRDSDAGDTANKYRIQVDDNSDFSSVFWDTGASGTSMTNCAKDARCQDISYSGSALTRGTTYYWRIKFWDVGGMEGVFSTESATFKINQLPSTPTNTSPTNGAGNQSLTPTLQSSAFSDADVGDTHSASQWQVSTASGAGFDAGIVWDTSSTATNLTSVVVNSTNGTFQGSLNGQTKLALNTTYYWRVRHQDDKTEWSSYSTITSFTTIVSNPPTTPTIPWCEDQTNPINVSNLTPSFSAIHNDPDGDAANFYQVEVNTNSSFTGTVMWNSTKTAMTSTNSGSRSPDIVYAGSELQLATIYYWRIRFWDVNGYEGVVSATQNFTMSGYISGSFSFEGLQMEGLSIN